MDPLDRVLPIGLTPDAGFFAGICRAPTSLGGLIDPAVSTFSVEVVDPPFGSPVLSPDEDA